MHRTRPHHPRWGGSRRLRLEILVVAAAGVTMVSLAGALLLALACAAAVVSGFFDGGYADKLTRLERVGQVALVAGPASLSVLADHGRRG
jgi:hypothetical protein